jgi:hypothetical protein
MANTKNGCFAICAAGCGGIEIERRVGDRRFNLLSDQFFRHGNARWLNATIA